MDSFHQLTHLRRLFFLQRLFKRIFLLSDVLQFAREIIGQEFFFSLVIICQGFLFFLQFLNLLEESIGDELFFLLCFHLQIDAGTAKRIKSHGSNALRRNQLLQILDFMLRCLETQLVRLQFDSKDTILLSQRIEPFDQLFFAHIGR